MIRPHLRRCVRDERGAAIIELALLTPILAALVIGVSEMALAYSTKLQLEQAAQRTIEKVVVSSAPATVDATLSTEATTAAGSPSSATVTYTLECDNVAQASYASTCTGSQVTARFVSVDITKTYSSLFQTQFLGSNASGSFTLHGKAGVRVQ